MNKEPIQMTPGDDLHLTLLMAPQSLNFVTGQDREHLLAFGRAAFDAGQSSKCLHQIAEPSAQTPEDAQIQALMRKHRIWIEHSTLFENDEPERELRAGIVKGVGHDNCIQVRQPGKTKAGVFSHAMDAAKLGLCPIGKPGDRIYVREAHAHHPEFAQMAFRADGEEFEDADGFLWEPKWTPAIHMKKEEARIWLEITGVRVERLQGISPDDCIAEGAWPTDQRELGRGHEAIGAFRELWDSTTGRPALPANTNSKRYARVKHWLDTHPDTTGWAANPWVWVIDFKTISTNGRPA